MRHNMDILSETYLKYSPQSIEALIGKGKESKSMRDALEEIKEYAAEDADVTFQLKEFFAVELEKTQTQQIIRRH
jgi:DNA polymerase-1